jgi:nickel superoxide dismutase
MNRKLFVSTIIVAVMAVPCSQVFAHCQIPCGIYDDPLRFQLMEEDVATIEKSMNEITRLSGEQQPDWNQLVRWIDNKDDHAQKLTDIVTYYFMTQRIKPASEDDKAAYSKYVTELTLLHQMMVYAMKAKQTTDLENCAALRGLIEQFRASYLGDEH